MSRVFLSYSRQDAPRAKALARALEAAGHDVWWDRHIRGGSRFGTEIAEALKDAEVVVVLWSRASIESAWVNDEAAEGRDTGRLVPILIDDCKPPLGFRQFQAIDLKEWAARGAAIPPELAEALEVEAPTRRRGNGGTLVILTYSALSARRWTAAIRGDSYATA